MSEPTPPEGLVEEIEVDPVDEPEQPEEGVIDPDDTYTEGGEADG